MTGSGPGGLLRVPGEAGPVADRLREDGWSVVVVRPSSSDAQLWQAVVDALDLPAWFGRNLDALNESLDDLVAPTAVVLATWTAYARTRPERWTRLLEVLRERAARPDPPVLVVLTD